MELTKLFKKFDKCMESGGMDAGCDGCPLMKLVVLQMGDSSDEDGSITWKIQACSVMQILSESLDGKTKKAAGTK